MLIPLSQLPSQPINQLFRCAKNEERIKQDPVLSRALDGSLNEQNNQVLFVFGIGAINFACNTVFKSS